MGPKGIRTTPASCAPRSANPNTTPSTVRVSNHWCLGNQFNFLFLGAGNPETQWLRDPAHKRRLGGICNFFNTAEMMPLLTCFGIEGTLAREVYHPTGYIQYVEH